MAVMMAPVRVTDMFALAVGGRGRGGRFRRFSVFQERFPGFFKILKPFIDRQGAAGHFERIERRDTRDRRGGSHGDHRFIQMAFGGRHRLVISQGRPDRAAGARHMLEGVMRGGADLRRRPVEGSGNTLQKACVMFHYVYNLPEKPGPGKA